MQPEQFLRFKQLVQEAQALPPGEQETFLARACADDPELRAEAESFLAGERQVPPDFLQEPALGTCLEPVVQGVREMGQGSTSRETPLPSTTPQPGEATTEERRLPRLPQVSGYEVLGELGRGGMGVVYKARQVGLERIVALKMILSRNWPTDGPLTRFRREAEVIAKLEHENIVPVYAFGEHMGQPYFALKYVEGGSLASKLNGTPWRPRQAAALVATLAGAVEYAHQRGILHRDLKPANVLLEARPEAPVQQWWPYLTDFGLARELKGGELTADGAVLGTPAYMAPEQARGEVASLKPWTDVFGLGAILYQLLTGYPPYRGETQKDLVDQATRGVITPPRQVRPDVSRTLERICLKALAADPGQRYATPAALERDLRRYLRRPLRLAVAAGAAAVFGMLTLLVVLLLGRPAPDSDAKPIPPFEEPLTGELEVRVWTAKNQDRGLVHEDGVAPVRNGEGIQLEARLNQAAHIYLLWIDSKGKAFPIYPWNRGTELEVEDVSAPAPVVQPQRMVRSPTKRDNGWKMEGPSGLETLVLLARRTPLPPDRKLSALIGTLAPAPLENPREVQRRGMVQGQSLALEGYDRFRRPAPKQEVINDSLLQMEERLQGDFEIIRAVRFGHLGE